MWVGMDVVLRVNLWFESFLLHASCSAREVVVGSGCYVVVSMSVTGLLYGSRVALDDL